MKSINHRNIRLIREDLTAYDTTIVCELPMPKFIIDGRKVFQKNKTIHQWMNGVEQNNSRTCYSEVSVTVLSNVEVTSVLPVDAKHSVVK